MVSMVAHQKWEEPVYHVTVIPPVPLTTCVIIEPDSVYVWKESQAGRVINVSRDMPSIRESVCKSKGNHSNYDMTFVLMTSLLLLPKILPFWGKILQFQSLILFQYSLMTLFTPNFAMPMDN